MENRSPDDLQINAEVAMRERIAHVVGGADGEFRVSGNESGYS